ncbi:MAG: hypothetical protein Q8Q31_03970 [Nanoarchaeota archaeon]|nr:hypothetical protein [Nanoarchaeota archaeon]
MKLISDFKNDLLKRRELKAIVEADSTPSFETSAKLIAEEYKASEDVIVVKGIYGKFGHKTFLIEAIIYDSVNDKNRTEPKKKEKTKGAAA